MTYPSSDDTENVDSAEIEKFNNIASRWWDKEGEFKPLHDINPLRLNYIKERCTLRGKNVLDVGCGGGILSESMAVHGASVTGIDMGEGPLKVAKMHLLESGETVDYQLCSAEKMSASHNGEYDVVTCLEMLEHVPDPYSIVKACYDMLKPGGDVFFSTINRNPKAFLFAIVGAEHILRLLPKGTHEYNKLIKPSELSNWARAAGLSVNDIVGMTFNPLTDKYSLTPNVAVNYLVHCSKPS